MTLATLIAIVLGIAVLVLLIFGFTTGWNNMWDKVTSYGGGKDNVAVIDQACKLACSTNTKYDYCTLERNLYNGTSDVPGSCDALSSKYVSSCPSIVCNTGASTTNTQLVA